MVRKVKIKEVANNLQMGSQDPVETIVLFIYLFETQHIYEINYPD